jgi:spermidine synthase
MHKNFLPIYIGIFFISIATLLLEISLTRIFSVSLWYHFAFMVISVSLFGFGASGTFLSLFPNLLKRNINRLLFLFSGLFSIFCIISFLITNSLTFDPFTILWDKTQILNTMIYYSALSIPFFFSGLCIAIVISSIPRKVNKIYFFNLVGSGIGSILILYLFSLVSSNVVIFVSLLGFLSTFLFSLNYSKRYVFLSLAGIFIVTFLLLNVQFEINISPYKDLNSQLRYENSSILFTQWNSFSRVDVIRSRGIKYAPGLSAKFEGEIPKQLGLTIDGGGLNAITSYNNTKFIDFLPMTLPYKLKKRNKVLILNAGGGLGILMALKNEANSIEAVEMNPIVVGAVGRFKGISGDIYSKVHTKIDEPRNFVRGSRENYDLIEIPLSGSVGTYSLYSLNENYLFTVEGFEDYYERLNPEGIISVTRWLLFPPKEMVRLTSLSVSSLEKQGIKNPEKHIALIRTWTTISLFLKKNEFTEEEIKKIKDFCREMKYDIVYLPNVSVHEVNVYNRFPEPYYYLSIKNLFENREKFTQDYVFDISPPIDDRPYFFNFFRWDKFHELYESMGKKWEPFFEGGFLIILVFFQALFLTSLLILLPLYAVKRKVLEINGKYRILAYFFCLGIGFMFIELALIHKFILFLGHPAYAISSVIFSILLFSGIGSLVSGRFEVKTKILTLVIAILSFLIILYMGTLPLLFNWFFGQDLFVRYVISILLLAPLSFFMGIPFPTGIRMLNKLDKNLIPWAWSVNACSSVLSSILAILIAIPFGFSSVLVLAFLVYLLGLGMIQKY